MAQLTRIVRHLLTPPWIVRTTFGPAGLRAAEDSIRAGERTHRGEIRLAIEATLDPLPIWRGQTARDRAVDLFGSLRVWDTEENNGVLVYLLLADHQVEIVADRGVHARVGAAAWEAICLDMESAFRAGRFTDGLAAGLQAIHTLLAREYPATGSPNPNELPDTPVVLR